MGRLRNPGKTGEGILFLGANPTNTDTMTIGGAIYTWLAAPVADRDIDIGADAAGSIVNAIAVINNFPPSVGVEASAHFLSTAAMKLVADLKGTSGNLALAETFTSGLNVFNGALMVLGAEKNLLEMLPIEHTVTAPEISAGGVQIDTGITAVQRGPIEVRSSTGVVKAITDLVTTSGTEVRIDIDGGTNIVAGDIIRFFAYATA